MFVPKAHLNVAIATHHLCKAHTSYAVRRTSFAKQYHFGEAALYIIGRGLQKIPPFTPLLPIKKPQIDQKNRKIAIEMGLVV